MQYKLMRKWIWMKIKGGDKWYTPLKNLENGLNSPF